jgi:hypothetical protein
VISSTVAHDASLFKNYLLDLDVEILRKDFIVDEAAREILVASAYNAAQDFVSSYYITSITESKDNGSPRDL